VAAFGTFNSTRCGGTRHTTASASEQRDKVNDKAGGVQQQQSQRASARIFVRSEKLPERVDCHK
jgi:hypothetical protein